MTARAPSLRYKGWFWLVPIYLDFADPQVQTGVRLQTRHWALLGPFLITLVFEYLRAFGMSLCGYEPCPDP